MCMTLFKYLHFYLGTYQYILAKDSYLAASYVSGLNGILNPPILFLFFSFPSFITSEILFCLVTIHSYPCLKEVE